MASIDAGFDDSARGASRLIWLVTAALAAFLAWSAFAALDTIVRAPGAVVSAARPQIVQNLEGGILAELHVAEGDRVEAGDTLARLSATQFEARAEELRAQLIAADIRRLRLAAEIDGGFDFDVPAAYAEIAPEIVASEKALLRARQTDHVSRIETATLLAEEAARELRTLEELHAREIVALFEVTDARRASTDAAARRSELVSEAELDRAGAYSETLVEINRLRQDLRAAEDRLARTVIRSPMAGTIKSVGTSTIGGVIQPGQDIFEIVPAGDALSLEAQVSPKDISNIVPGQRVTIKLSAYDYTIYGTLSGKVDLVSADTFRDERDPRSEAHYKVIVRLDPVPTEGRQAGIELRPGLQATVELHTGERTVLNYLTKPLMRSSEALREP